MQREVLRLAPHGSTPGPRSLLTAPLWLLGGALVGLETVANVAALGLAPVAIIQPVGTLSLIVASRLLVGDGLDPAAWTVLAGLAPASAAGVWLVQTAHASGSAASVLAGLTVIDPLTAIAVGGLVLGEARPVPVASAILLLVSAVAALRGVHVLVHRGTGTRAPASSPAPRAADSTMEGARGEGVPAPS